jgi:hypothetical protein
MKKKGFKINDKIITKLKKKEDNMENKISLVGHGVFELRDKKTGKVIDREETHNTIVNSGLERVAKLITSGEAADAFQAIAIGTGDTAVDNSDTSLETEVTRAQADNSGGEYEADYKAVFEKTFTFGSGESYSITEAGIFDSATESGSTMLDRFTFSSKSVDSDTDIYIKISITIARS